MMSNARGKPYRPWNPDHYRQASRSPEAKLPENERALFLLDTLPHLDLNRFYAPYAAATRGAPSFEPKMMLCLLLYAYCVEAFASRNRFLTT